MGNQRQSAMMENTLQELWRHRSLNSPKTKPHILVLFTTHMIGMETGLSYLRKLREENIMARLCAEEDVFSEWPPSKLASESGYDDWIPHAQLSESAIQCVDAVFLPVLSFSMAADILALNERRCFARMAIAALFSGKKVIGLKAGLDPHHPLWKRKGFDRSKNEIRRKLNDYMLQLQSFGIMLIDEKDRADFKHRGPKKKSVVTGETIHCAYQQNQTTIMLAKSTIVTPLARDLAKKFGISLILE